MDYFLHCLQICYCTDRVYLLQCRFLFAYTILSFCQFNLLDSTSFWKLLLSLTTTKRSSPVYIYLPISRTTGSLQISCFKINAQRPQHTIYMIFVVWKYNLVLGKRKQNNVLSLISVLQHRYYLQYNKKSLEPYNFNTCTCTRKSNVITYIGKQVHQQIYTPTHSSSYTPNINSKSLQHGSLSSDCSCKRLMHIKLKHEFQVINIAYRHEYLSRF